MSPQAAHGMRWCSHFPCCLVGCLRNQVAPLERSRALRLAIVPVKPQRFRVYLTSLDVRARFAPKRATADDASSDEARGRHGLPTPPRGGTDPPTIFPSQRFLIAPSPASPVGEQSKAANLANCLPPLGYRVAL